MGIFSPDAPKTIKITASDLVNREKRKNAAHREDIRVHLKESFDNVWNNKLFTPQEMVAAWGTDATAAFMAHFAEQQFLKSVDQSYVILEAPFVCIPQADGTVVVGDKKT